MRHANRPSGPGKPTNERRDAAVASEELDETLEDRAGADAEGSTDPARDARGAERNAHVKGRNTTAASGTSGNRRRG
jgi:hypothetical protein